MKKKYKSRKDGEVNIDDLQEIIESAVDSAVGKAMKTTGDDDGDAKRKSRKTAEVTEESIAEVIQDVLAEAQTAIEDAKARKAEDGEDWTDEDEAAAQEELVDAIAGAVAESVIAEAEAAADEGAKAEENDSGAEAKAQKALKRSVQSAVKSALGGGNRPAPTSRKYAHVFMGDGKTNPKGVSAKDKEVPAEVQVARAVKCLSVYGHGDPQRAATAAREIYGDQRMEAEFKALNATSPVDGGYLIPEAYLDELIELLYPGTVVFELGAQQVPMPSGNLNIPKFTSGSRATWAGELRKMKGSKPSYGNLRLSSKRLDSLIPCSRELLLSSSFNADAMFARDLTTQLRLGIDYGALFGKGGEFQPKGVTETEGVEHFAINGELEADMLAIIRAKVLFKNVAEQGMGWTFNSLVEGALLNLKSDTGEYLFRDELLAGKLMGAPFKVSNQVGVNKSKRTQMIFGNWSDLMVGDQLGLQTEVSTEAAYTDESGKLVSAFENHVSLLKAWLYCDIGLRHSESFLIVDGVDVSAFVA